MLGDKLGELRGDVTGQRVLPSAGGPKVETSFQVTGQLTGVDITLMGTYWSIVRPDGSLYGECPDQGVVMTADGDVGTWNGAGVGRFTGQGAGASFRGAIYLQKAPAKLAHLASTAILHEWDIDANGKATGVFWSWN